MKMERKCADVLKEALMLHTKEINDLVHNADHWKQKCESQQNHKQRLQEECKALENKIIGMQSTIESLKEQIQDLKESHRESSSLRCRMCDHLQRMNDSLNEAYTNNIREKDRRIADLENQLFECTKNLSLEKTWTSSNNTPHKPRRQQKASLNTSLRSESPDSTSRNTPNKPNTVIKEAAKATTDNRTIESSLGESTKVNNEEKGPKLRLRTRKRNRYTEDPSPENKRQKIHSKDYTEEESSQLLVPETCDPDIIAVDHEESPGEEEGHHLIPDTEAGVEGTSSDSESDPGHERTGNRYSLRSSLFSPSSEESDTILKSPRRKAADKKTGQCHLEEVKKKTSEKDSNSDKKLPLVEGCDGYIQSSPIFQVYKKSNLESPDVKKPDTGLESDAESPLLLKISKNLDENGAKEGSPAKSRLFDEDCESIVSPVANSSFSKFRSLSQGSRQRGRLNQSKLSCPEERKRKSENGESWLNSTKPAVKDSPTLRQSTLSQVFMNVPTKPQPEKSSESDDIQKAIELSLRDQEKGRSECADVDMAQKENLSPFKRPITPRKCKKSAGNVLSFKNRKRKNRQTPIDCDPDETVPPGSVELCPEPASVGVPLNGSIDPVVQLSVLCDDSQSLKSDDLPDIEPYTEEDGAGNMESYTEIDRAENSSQIGNLTDFRIEDLRKAPNPLTSTYIDVENPPHGVEDGSLSVPCSAVLSSGQRKIIRIPDNSEDSNSESLIPNHEDSFDRVPGKEQPNFAHVDVVRKQDERRRLPAHKCEECREYFEGMGLSEEEIQKRLQTCSRHRAKHAAPGTPEHFWDIGMEDTLECEERGYVNTKDPDEGKPRFRRKRQLNKMFKSKKEEVG